MKQSFLGSGTRRHSTYLVDLREQTPEPPNLTFYVGNTLGFKEIHKNLPRKLGTLDFTLPKL